MSASPKPDGGDAAEPQARTTTERLRRASYIPRVGAGRAMREAIPHQPPVLEWLRSPAALVLCLIVVGIVARLVLARVVGLGIDESYEVAVSSPFSLSYFDHPPLSFWIPAAVTALAGGAHRVLLRLPFILLFAGTTWMMFVLGARLFGARAGAIAALILNVSPVFSLSAGSWILPDGPLMFWMLATTLCLERVLVPREQSSIEPLRAAMWWIAAGACAGLALLSKYHGAFLMAGAGMYVLTQRDARRWLRHPAPYLGAAAALALFSPVLVWNARHGWVSFRFQGGRGATPHGVHLASFLENIAGQAGYVLPWIFVPLAWVLVSVIMERCRVPLAGDGRDPLAAERRRDDAARWLLACLAIGPIATFTLISLGGKHGLPHWEAPGWLMVIPLLAATVDRRLARGRPGLRRRTMQWLVGSTVAYALLLTPAAIQASTGWLQRAAPSLVARGDPTVDTIDWLELPSAIAPYLGAGDGRAFVALTTWTDAGKAGYALGHRADVVCLCDEPHHFAYLHDVRSYAGRDAVIIERADKTPQPPVTLARDFRSVEPIGSMVVRRAGRPAVTLMFYRGAAFAPDRSAGAR